MRNKWILYTFLVLCGIFSTSFKFVVPDYKFHSVYVYNFTKYIQWPTNNINFTINILDNEHKVFESFKMMADAKSSENKKYVVNKFNNVSELTDCDILFIPSGSSNKAEEAINKFKDKHTLVITEKPGLITSGSSINFVIQDSKLKFEINKSALEKAGLKVSSQLMQMAIVK